LLLSASRAALLIVTHHPSPALSCGMWMVPVEKSTCSHSRLRNSPRRIPVWEDLRKLADPRHFAEPKLDGQRAQVHVRGGRTVGCYSRPGHDLEVRSRSCWRTWGSPKPTAALTLHRTLILVDRVRGLA
jgi:hypothetical protein